MERVRRIELPSDAWKAPVFPLNYTHKTWKIFVLPKVGTTSYPTVAILAFAST
jgi:hypothetical protein